MAPESLSSTASEASMMADDVFSDESDFHGSVETKSTYQKLAASYDPQKYWAVHEWSTQVNAAKGRVAWLEAARLRAELALRKQQQAERKIDDGKAGPQQAEGEIRVGFDGDGKKGDGDGEMDIDTKVKAPASPDPDTEDEDGKDDRRAPPRNFYEGIPSAKQLSESVSDFLARLPPSTTTSSLAGRQPWIWIANPYPDPVPSRRSAGESRSTSTSTSTSTDPEFSSGDVATFRQLGTRLLERYLSRKHETELQNPGKVPGSITRMLRPDRLQLESDIRELAKAHRVTAGKWMLFPRDDEVDTVWAVVARGVWDGKLGTGAKVATAKGEGEMVVDDDNIDDGGGDGKDNGLRLICIYTRDFSDQADVKRVLQAMKDLGLLSSNIDLDGRNAGLRTIYYKCDAYTHLGLSSGNEYKLRASMYSSRDLFPAWYNGGAGAGRGH
ncbi:hypothetical protein AYO21_09432 [Fonsecaea monophora]|uniref:DUF1917 domain-containing protein n=1 Tax=Fonsecaea monophora TaxID=254056 RepID=A0A177EWD2_9EURO|nr:hypothetical protein AYO21_09432 [Fonsecaea monophora]KAH0835212.1 DNA polymerase II large subunit-like protein [Fonsecaea pedrosoi]OAG36353.1 hypothetical protein AYO21_09432 [Fonsecaea monophora]